MNFKWPDKRWGLGKGWRWGDEGKKSVCSSHIAVRTSSRGISNILPFFRQASVFRRYRKVHNQVGATALGWYLCLKRLQMSFQTQMSRPHKKILMSFLAFFIWNTHQSHPQTARNQYHCLCSRITLNTKPRKILMKKVMSYCVWIDQDKPYYGLKTSWWYVLIFECGSRNWFSFIKFPVIGNFLLTTVEGMLLTIRRVRVSYSFPAKTNNNNRIHPLVLCILQIIAE